MLYSFLRPLLFSLEPERAHHLALRSLRLLQTSPLRLSPCSDPVLSQKLWGLSFPNPVGLAAGYDKNALAPLAWPLLGFGFAELGTITAHAQPGNPKPRIFRLPQDEACINRLGFNNDGAASVAQRLASVLPSGSPHPIPLGFNIGKSRITPLAEAINDYTASYERLFPFADYFVVNVSSPNTPDLRKLQEVERLARLLEALSATNQRLATAAHTHTKPILVKIAPDLHDAEITEIARTARAVGVAGLIAVNTTITRPAMLQASCQEDGGLSGRPLAQRATEVMRVLFHAVEGQLPLIGVGGIFSAQDAYMRIRAGASLVQVYTGLIYQGPFLPRRIAHGLKHLLGEASLSHVSDAVGKDV